jgi:molybdopterin-guanine dinucleotide biosynthesis protein A
LQPAFIQFLVDRLGEEAVVAPWDGERYHPLSAVYRRSVLPEVEAMLREECFRLTLLLHRCPVRDISTDQLREIDPDLRSLRNVNTPEDYRSLLDLAEDG